MLRNSTFNQRVHHLSPHIATFICQSKALTVFIRGFNQTLIKMGLSVCQIRASARGLQRATSPSHIFSAGLMSLLISGGFLMSR